MEYTEDDMPYVVEVCRTVMNKYVTSTWKNYGTYNNWLDNHLNGSHDNRPEQIIEIFTNALGSSPIEGSQLVPHKEALRKEIEGVLSMAGGTLFTKKHYLVLGEAIGKAIEKVTKSTKPEHLEPTLNALSVIVTEMTDTFKEDNSRFKREDFLASLITKREGTGTT